MMWSVARWHPRELKPAAQVRLLLVIRGAVLAIVPGCGKHAGSCIPPTLRV